MRLGNTQKLGLAARDLTVELGVAEQSCALVLLSDLRRLALGKQSAVAHVAVTAGDVEGNDDAVAGLDVGHVRTNLLHHAHRLVAEDVALVDERAQDLIEVEI